MKAVVRRTHRNRRRRAGAGALLACAVVVLLQFPAGAQIELPQLPIPTETPLIEGLLDDLLSEDSVSGTVDPVVDVVGDATQQINGLLEGSNGGTAPKQPGSTVPRVVGDPSTLQPTNTAPLPGQLPTVKVSGRAYRPSSYASAVSDGITRAARRAASLAGPVAAPMALALFAVMLLFVAARGPGRLVKVEEERKVFREQRSFRL